MKRTALKRRVPLATKATLKRTGPVRVRRPGKRRSSAWRSPSYLAWVRTLPCCVCGCTGGNEAHHIKGVGHHSGAGIKACDSLTMSLCPTHHRELHATPEQWPLQVAWVAMTRVRARAEGWVLPDDRSSAGV